MTAQPYWRSGAAERRGAAASATPFAQDRRRLRVGLVNNMPDAALAATERQFAALFQAAVPERRVELVRLHLPGVSRGEAAQARIEALYRPANALEAVVLDALVVTGAEPRAADLRAEPFWDAFTRLVDWAAATGVPTLWSCLAAHAAVLHLDGVARRPLAQKCSGLYACRPAPGESLTAGLAPAWVTPHSRNNTLDEAELVASGHRILTRSDGAGVDIFVRDRFLFLQGHPEYDPSSLALEFKRDLQRYLDGARAAPPSLPCDVFRPDAARRLDALLAEAATDRSPIRWPDLADLPMPENIWRSPVAQLLRNWLAASHEGLTSGSWAQGHGAGCRRDQPT